MRKWTLLLTCSLVFLGHPCRADEEYEGARGAAKKVVELARAKKDEDLKKFAAEAGVDPWLILDALLEVQANDAAKAYAAAHEGKDAEALRAVAARGLKEPSDARARLAAAEVALAAPIPEDGDPIAVAESLIPLWKGGESISDGILRVRWLSSRAAALLRAGRRREAASDLGLAAKIAAKAGWAPRAALLLSSATEASIEDHDLRRALETLTRLSELQHSLEDRLGEADSLMAASEIHQRFGESRPALARVEESLRALPADAPPAARAIRRARRGAILAGLGEFRLAQIELSGAVEALSALNDPLDLADAENSLGHLYRDLGDFAGAREAYQSALAAYGALDVGVSTPTADAKSAGVAAAKASLATILASEGKFQAAHDEFRAQREAFLAADDRVMAARSLQSMADVRIRQSSEASDLKLRSRWLEEARSNAIGALAESGDAQDPEGVLRAKGNRGEAEEGLGHIDVAIRDYEDVIAEAETRGHLDISLEYCVALARTRLLRENPNGAIEAVEEGFRCLTDRFGDLGDQVRVSARAQHAELFSFGMRAALQKAPADGIPLLFRFMEKGRAAALLDALENREALRAWRVPPELERARTDAARALTERRVALSGHGDESERRGAIGVAQAAYERAVDAIEQATRAAGHPAYPQPTSLVDAQSNLGLAEALVLYAVVGSEALALLVTRDAAVPIPLGAADPLLDACRATLVRGSDEDAAKVWSRAADVVWRPIERLLPAGVTTVYVSPDGNLGLVPYPALPPSPIRRTFLFVPSASTLGVLRERKSLQGTATLAVGIENYIALPALPGGAFRSRGQLVNLPSAELEAGQVASEPGDRLLRGPEATEEAVLAMIATKAAWRAIHFAVHGLLNSDNPRLASLALVPSKENDGDLTAFEIFQHDIPASVAVLAACDSANGGYVRGEGLVGLVRAFIFAGCPIVVASLWNANDDAAKAFSVAFHNEWRKGAPVSAAIESARSAVRTNPKWKHPFYWAGWCAWGAESRSERR